MRDRIFLCIGCRQRWEETPRTESGKQGYDIICPSCGSVDKVRIVDGGGKKIRGGAQDIRHCETCGHPRK